jgi:hypothetical protein
MQEIENLPDLNDYQIIPTKHCTQCKYLSHPIFYDFCTANNKTVLLDEAIPEYFKDNSCPFYKQTLLSKINEKIKKFKKH